MARKLAEDKYSIGTVNASGNFLSSAVITEYMLSNSLYEGKQN